MPYKNSSSDEETASSAKGRRGRHLRRRVRGGDDDSSDDDSKQATSGQQEATETTTTTTTLENSTLSSPQLGQPESPTQPSTQQTQDSNLILEEPDSDTLRIMVSTDNHVGFAEGDDVRGNDSFAALEEVLYLAKQYSCDMVMLAGDLFHENRPSRRTLFKTMDIFRRYCMGPGAIQVQVVSGSTNASKSKSPFARGYVNYEDANYSVDLPVFSIHGNHDDPSRDGGNSELYAALDLLDVVNLVNYFGRQEDTQDIRVDPILLKKGKTKVAMYGLGSMRDERLNRMWRGGKLSFSRPSESSTENTDEDGDSNNPSWFNIFAIHQNRDRGRGAKNCIKEDMIPEWIDFVCWGHEHECGIELTESVVGTFRISQPGSSVATSYTEGESMRKKVGLLDVREGQFRLTSIPLTQVRSFVVSTVKLAEEPSLDPDDPKVEAKVTKVLEDKVRVSIHDAREKRRELLQDAQAGGNGLARYYDENVNVGRMPLKHTLNEENQVLVRLKIDHSGFATMNNQRFGSQFIGNVANPTDILLFQRKKSEEGESKAKKSIKDIAPIEPADVEEIRIEELIVEQFESNATTKLNLYDDKKISSALDSYVGKQEAQAINMALGKHLDKQQDRLIQNEAGAGNTEDHEEEEAERGSKRKAKKSSSRGRKQDSDDYSDEDEVMEESPVAKSRSKASQKSTRKRASRKTSSHNESDSDDYREDDSSRAKPASKSRAASRAAGRGRKAAASCDDSEDEDVRVVDPPPRVRKRTAKKPINYSIDESDGIGDEDDMADDPSPPPKPKRGRGTTARAASSKKVTTTTSKRGRGSIESSSGLSQTQLSFQPAKRKTSSQSTTTSKKRARTTRGARYDEDSDSGDSFTLRNRSYDDDGDDWGTAKSGSTH